jgi:hypothetical protein
MKHIKLFEDVWETLNFSKLNNDLKYFVTDLKDNGFKIITFDNERDSFDEYDYVISIFSRDSFKADYIKDNLDTIIDYINEFYSYDTISYTLFYRSIWPETKTGSEKIEDYNLYLDSTINRLDIEIQNIKKL